MSDQHKDELIQAQNELIGILWEIIKRFQANNSLDEEYFEIICNEKQINTQKLDEILKKRQQNSVVISQLLEKIKI